VQAEQCEPLSDPLQDDSSFAGWQVTSLV